MSNAQCRTWRMARKLKIMENHKHTLQDLKYGKNSVKRDKWEMQTVGPGIWQETVKNVKNEKYTLLDGNMARKLKKVENKTQTLD